MRESGGEVLGEEYCRLEGSANLADSGDAVGSGKMAVDIRGCSLP